MSVLMLPFYTAWLSVEQYGDVDLVSTYVSLIMGLVTLCMTDAIFRFPQGCKFSEQRNFFTSGISLVSISILVFGFIYFLVLYLWGNNSWGIIYTYSGYIYFILIFSFIQLYFQQFSRSIDRMGVYVTSGIVLTSLTVVVSLFLVPKYGANGFLLSQIVGFIGASFYTFFKIRIYHYLSISHVSLPVIKEMLAYSIPMIPNATLWWLLGTSNRLFLEYFQGVEQVGIFAVSNRFPSIITMVFNTFFLSWQISVLEEFKKTDFKRFYNNIFRVCFVLLITVSILLSISSFWLIKVFASEKFIESWRYIPFLGVASVFSSLSTFAGTMFMAFKKTRYYLTTSLWGALFCVLLNLILIRWIGIMGATLSLLISHLLILILRIVKSDRYVLLDSKISYLVQIIITVIIAGIVISGVNKIYSLSLILISIITLSFLNWKYVLLAKKTIIQFIKHKDVS